MRKKAQKRKRRSKRYKRTISDSSMIIDTNADPIQVIFRLDGGFTNLENIYWLIEMGYEVYTRGCCTIVRDALSNALNPEMEWVRVDDNAELKHGMRQRSMAILLTQWMLYWLITTQATQFAGQPYCIMDKLRLSLTWTLGFTCTMAVKLSKQASKKAKMSFKCIISRCVRPYRFLKAFIFRIFELFQLWLHKTYVKGRRS